jgi:hypothetical protein
VSTLKAPFPWFGGKASIAPLVWERFGTASNYVEPFFGSGAMLLGRPNSDGTETVNDLDGYLANFWRAIQAAPDEVARHADWPVNECDLHARHAALVRAKPEHVARLMGDPDYYDANLAGWWVWGLCSWIGSGWCSGQGPWQVIDGALANARKLPHLGDAGQGINRQIPHLGNAGQGINRQIPHLGNAGRGIYDTFAALSARLRGVRVCCGDWSRVCGPSVTVKHGLTAVFLDPPYSETAGREKVYTHDCMKVAHDVREWAIASGSNPLLRIALAGYEGEHAMPDDWQCVAWKASGGYEGQGKEPTGNCRRERLWFSPHCEKPELLLL